MYQNKHLANHILPPSAVGFKFPATRKEWTSAYAHLKGSLRVIADSPWGYTSNEKGKLKMKETYL
jgi:hypothetical protein